MTGEKNSVKKPVLYLTGQKHGQPTMAHLVALVKNLTGKNPTPETIAQVENLHQARTQETAATVNGRSVQH